MPERPPNSKAAQDGAANGKGCDVDRITCRGITALGVGVAGIAIAIVEPASGGVEEGRSVAGWPSPVVMRAEGVLHAGMERWEPRGKAWVCRSWCEEGTSACIEVCGPAAP